MQGNDLDTPTDFASTTLCSNFTAIPAGGGRKADGDGGGDGGSAEL